MKILETLPNSEKLNLRMKSLATLDAIFSPEWEYRYYSFDSNWSTDEEMGSIRNGSGDDVFMLFNSSGCFMKGFAHEYRNSKIIVDSLYAGVPQVFETALKEPAFSPDNATFCFWSLNAGRKWESSVSESDLDIDSFFLIQDLAENEENYQNFVTEYYEVESEIQDIQAVFDHQPLTQSLAEAINQEIDYSSLLNDN